MVETESRSADTEESLETLRRSQLLRATMECVAEAGVERTTMYNVAERAGVSTGMVLHYYRTKRKLINAAVDLATREFGKRLYMATEGTFGPERLKESIRIFLHDPEGSIPANFLIQYRMAALNDEEIRQTSLSQYENSRRNLAKSVRAAQERGQIRPDVSDYALADLVYALANGLAAEMAAHPEIMSLDRALEVAQVALRAFASPDSELEPARVVEAPIVTQVHASDTADAVEALLLNDRRLEGRTARRLAGAFRSLYAIAAGESGMGTTPGEGA